MPEFTVHFNELQAATVDNDPVFLLGLRGQLEKLGCKIAWQAENREEALEKARAALPDVVFVDLGLSSTRNAESLEIGRSLASDLRGLNPHMGIIIYSTGPVYTPIVLEAIRMGWSYLIKESVTAGNMEEIVTAALLAASSRCVILTLDVARSVDVILNKMKGKEQLSPQLRKVLELLVEGYSNAEIGKYLHISVNTVRTHFRRIYEIIGVNSQKEAIKWYNDNYGS